jgi:hypothetical protein
MRQFFALVERPQGIRMLWEPRGPWPPELVLELCRELDLVHVVDPFADATVSPEQTYFGSTASPAPSARIGDARRFRAMVGSTG